MKEECGLLCHLAKCWAARLFGRVWLEHLHISDLMSCATQRFVLSFLSTVVEVYFSVFVAASDSGSAGVKDKHFSNHGRNDLPSSPDVKCLK